MYLNDKVKQILVFSLPIWLLLVMVVPYLWTVSFGEEISLKTEPIDPVDLFRGYYVSLGYDIEQVPFSVLESSLQKERDSLGYGEFISVYVVLEKGESGFHEVVSVLKNKPQNGTYIKADLESGGNIAEDEMAYLNYDLDTYYTSKDHAQRLEEETSLVPATAVVKVKNGNAILTDVLIEK